MKQDLLGLNPNAAFILEAIEREFAFHHESRFEEARNTSPIPQSLRQQAAPRKISEFEQLLHSKNRKQSQ